MRILVCASAAPIAPLDGMRLQLRALLEELARRHEICVLAPVWPGQHGAPPAGVELVEVAAPPLTRAARARDRARSIARREPVDAVRLTGAMAAAVRELVARRRFDVAHVGLGELAGIAPALGDVPAVLAPLDAWTLNAAAEQAAAVGARRAWLGAQRRLVARHVAHAYRPFARVVLVSAQDARETLRLDPSLRVSVIPNGVDAARFAPDPAVAREPGLVVFSGAMHAAPNVAAAEQLATAVLGAVREDAPHARLALVGRAPAPAVRALAAPGVEVAADVPDMRPWLRRAGVYACPMVSGTGIKNKLLEAMACAAPCVVTPLACRGLQVRDGEHLLIAEPGAPFARAVARLLADPALAARLGERARAYVVARHTWAAVAEAYEALYADISAEPSTAASAANSGG